MSGNQDVWTVLHLVRITIEATSPLSLTSGDARCVTRGKRKDGAFVETEGTLVDLMRDANDLVTIPGSSLQGALRAAFEGAHGPSETNALFGWANGDDGDAGRLVVGFGCVHNADDVAVTGLMTTPTNDPVLTLLRGPEPLRRDHVAINARGAADGRAKFDRIAAPRGTRYSFELALWGLKEEAEADRERLKQVVALVRSHGFRLGGASRRGYGTVKIVRASYAQPNLSKPNELRALRNQPPSRCFETDWSQVGPKQPGQDRATRITLTLAPINPWRIGGGSVDGGGDASRIWRSPPLTPNTRGIRRLNGAPAIQQPDGSVALRGREGVQQQYHAMRPRDPLLADDKRDAIAAIVREPEIIWDGGRGTIREVTTPADDAPVVADFVAPGSALKGPLVHRTQFHWQRGEGHFVDPDDPCWSAKTAEARRDAVVAMAKRADGLKDLLGTPKERRPKGTAPGEATTANGREQRAETGRAARIFVSDATVRNVHAVMALDHNVLDRFTGGVIDQLLYSEETLVGGRLEVAITIAAPRDEEHWSPKVVAAFTAAVADLCRGRLAIGAKSLGFCTGTAEVAGHDAGVWRASLDDALQKRGARDDH